MFFGGWTSQQVADSLRGSSCFLICLLSVGLLAGCNELCGPRYPKRKTKPKSSAQVETPAQHRLAAKTSIAETPIAEASSTQGDELASKSEVGSSSDLYWSFPSASELPSQNNPSVLIQLPEIAAESHPKKSLVEELIAKLPPSDAKLPFDSPIAQLLPPQLPPQPLSDQSEPSATISANELSKLTADDLHTEMRTEGSLSSPPVLDKLTKQQQQLALQLQDASSAATGVLTDVRVNELAKRKIQHAYAMANRGAYYVARQELIEVLRLISQAKDAQLGSPERTLALAAGLRALSEAEDFAPRGTQLEAELDITVLCASHRTPVAKQPESAKLLPRLMLDRYLRYAQLQLAMSVAGEPAGSMALHALGKLNSQFGRLEPDKHRLAARHAIAYQQAALLAHHQNYLAAHELGVLLATSGHIAEAEQLLLQVAAREPNAVVYRNLAIIQQELGQPAQAMASQDNALALAQQGATGTNRVQWVSPDQFAQAGAATPRLVTAQRSNPNQLPIPGSQIPVQPTRRR